MIDVLEDNIGLLRRLCRKYRVKRLGVFGSAVTASEFDNQSSDVDFVVEFEGLKPTEHADCYFGLLEELQDAFGREVDLVEIKAVRNPYLLESIEQSRREIYAA